MKIVITLDHPSIAKTFELLEDTQHMFISMEYCSGGDMFDELIK